ncbi:MAG: hypothetical protein WCI48_14750 [Bacteroidota bacterium]|jgi:hypothetical protein
MALSAFSGCNCSRDGQSGFRTLQCRTQKVECLIQPSELFDTVLIFHGSKLGIRCITECAGEFLINDTINDTLVKQYRDRQFRFIITGEQTKGCIVTKKLFRKDYPDRMIFEKSVLACPRFEKIDTSENAVMIHARFLFPKGLEGTDEFDDIFFDIRPDGTVFLKKIRLYQAPSTNDLNP